MVDSKTDIIRHLEAMDIRHLEVTVTSDPEDETAFNVCIEALTPWGAELLQRVKDFQQESQVLPDE